MAVSVPEGDVRGYVVLFSGADGSRPDAGPLTRAGALVVEVDTRAYFAAIRRDAKPCDQLVGDAESLSRQLQRRYPALQYAFPILAGAGQGGTLAYAILAQAPANTLAGAVSLDPSESVSGLPALCPGAPAAGTPDGATRYGPKADLQGFWSAAFDAGAAPAGRAHVADLAAGGTPVTVLDAAAGDPAAVLVDLVAPHLSRATRGGVDELPLIALPADRPGPLLAVILSGDGGWRDIDKAIAERLQRRGVSVVGWDCLRYFWRRKTPEQAADDLAAVLGTYLDRWKAERVALVGYSFGADVLPFLYGRLPSPLRDRVALVSLLGLGERADWEITVGGWLGRPPTAAATPLAPALAGMPGGLVQCVYGTEEHESACPALAAHGAELIETTGGHHFGGDYAGLADRIMSGLERRAAPRP